MYIAYIYRLHKNVKHIVIIYFLCIGVIYQIRRVELDCGRVVHCIWLSRDPAEAGAFSLNFLNLTLSSSLNQSSLSAAAAQINTSANASSILPSAVENCSVGDNKEESNSDAEDDEGCEETIVSISVVRTFRCQQFTLWRNSKLTCESDTATWASCNRATSVYVRNSVWYLMKCLQTTDRRCRPVRQQLQSYHPASLGKHVASTSSISATKRYIRLGRVLLASWNWLGGGETMPMLVCSANRQYQCQYQ